MTSSAWRSAVELARRARQKRAQRLLTEAIAQALLAEERLADARARRDTAECVRSAARSALLGGHADGMTLAARAAHLDRLDQGVRTYRARIVDLVAMRDRTDVRRIEATRRWMQADDAMKRWREMDRSAAAGARRLQAERSDEDATDTKGGGRDLRAGTGGRR